MSHRPRILVLLGPTASGKTALAMEVARLLDGEIISADSRQAYRGLEIGTAAPTEADRASVPHHGVAFLEPGERYGAGRFTRECRRWIREIESRGRVPILAGGTGFFVSALTRPVFREPALDPDRRQALGDWLAGQDLQDLRRWTARLDPGVGSRLRVVDRQRAGRAIELALLTGRNLSWWQANAPPEAAPIPARTWILEIEAESHRRRIERRAEAMLDSGWPEEVQNLAAGGYGPGSPAMTSIGYRDVWRMLQGEISRAEAVAAIVGDTWQYARRQRTWLRHQPGHGAIRVRAEPADAKLPERIAADWRRITGSDTAEGRGETG